MSTRFVAVGDSGTVMVSDDLGVTWQSGFASVLHHKSVAYIPELQLWLMGGGTTAYRVWTNPDPLTTVQTEVAANAGQGTCFCVDWSPDLSLALATAGSSGANNGKINTSPDTTTWTAAFDVGGTAGWGDAAWSPALGLWAVTRFTGSTSYIYTSPDGATWTQRLLSWAVGERVETVGWSASLGLFVAAGSNGRMSTSSDGVTWTSRTSGFGATGIFRVRWVSTLGKFIAVGNSGTMTSSADGITWATETTGVADGLRGIAHSADSGVIVVVGLSGRVITSPDTSIATWTARTSSTAQNLNDIDVAETLIVPRWRLGRGATTPTATAGWRLGHTHVT